MKKIYKNSLIFVFGLIIAGIASIFLTTTFFTELKEEAENYLEIKEDFVVGKEKIKNLDEKSGSDIKRKSDDIERLFINANRPVQAILFLEELSEDNNLNIEINKTGNRTSAAPWPYLEFRLQVNGSADNAFSFFDQLNSGRYIFNTRNIEVLFQGGGGFFEGIESEVSVNAIVEAYYLNN